MFLPEHPAFCIKKLEQAGFAAYAVGGCVRDDLLGIKPHDYDLCTSATPQQIQAVFHAFPQVLAGVKHGTVGIVLSHDVIEITTFRQEGSYQDNRHPDWVAFVADIDRDLARRDFTVNAIAYSPTRGYADPFGGREDLRKGILRSVGNAQTRFQEDALRILRGVRFSVRFGLAVDPQTASAMLAEKGRMDSLARERVYEELTQLLPLMNAEDVVRFSPILAQVIPELAPMIGFDQHSPHHAYDLITHTAHVVEAVPKEAILRWAALLHDIGKIPCFTRDENGRGHFYGHAQVGAEMADKVLRCLKAPTSVREEAVWLIDHHMTRLQPDRRLLKRYLSRHGYDRMNALLALQEADMGSKGTGEDDGSSQFSQVRQLLTQLQAEEACLTLHELAVNGHDLIALGYSGKAIGQLLQQLLELVLDEKLPNEKQALLNHLQGGNL